MGAGVAGQAPHVADLDGTPVLVQQRVLGSPARVVDLATGEPLGQPITGGPVATVARLDGRAIMVTGGYDGVLRTWDLATGEPLPTTMTGHTESISDMVAGEADGRVVVASASSDDTVRLWDLRTGEPIAGPLPGVAGAIFELS